MEDSTKNIMSEANDINYKSALVFVLIFFSIIRVTLAQSDNYWSWTFNTPSMLVAGSVVGGGAGPSAVFYNPALINHEQVPSLTLSANLVSLQSFKANNIAGEGIDADKLIFKIQPRFLSYILPSKNERFGLSAAILSPDSEEIEFTIQHFDELDIIKRTQGMETYAGYLKYSRRYDDTWVGFGASYKLSDKFYLGVSSFVSIKVLKYQYEKSAQAYQQGDSVVVGQNTEAKYIAESSYKEEMKYWDLSFVFKGGVQYKSENEQLNIGANITFPNIRFIGQADVRKSLSRSNVYDDSENAFTSNENFIEFEEDGRTKVKTPFSTALGIQYFTNSGKNSISFTVEYFHDIDPYSLIDLPPEKDFLSYTHSANSVTNAGFGFKQYISPSFMMMGGFRTDFTSGKKDEVRFVDDSFKINQIHMDKYHITVGPVLKIKRFDLITGIQYTFGRNYDLDPLVNYADPAEYIPQTKQSLEGLRQNEASTSLNELSLFFGLTVNLDKEKI